MRMFAPAWSIQEYDANESSRIPADALQTEQFYYLGLPNRGGRPDAYRALVQVENLQRKVGTLALGVMYYSRDMAPLPNGAQPSTMRDDFWVPNQTLHLNFANKDKESVSINTGYFIPYEDPIDIELREVKDSLSLPVGFSRN